MSSSGAENIVLYDWLSFTSKNHTPEELIDALGLSHVNWTVTKGARGYRDRKYFSCISVHYNGRPDMGVWVEMSGQGCRTFESLSAVGWEDLFLFIRGNGLKITRLDVANEFLPDGHIDLFRGFRDLGVAFPDVFLQGGKVILITGEILEGCLTAGDKRHAITSGQLDTSHCSVRMLSISDAER